MTNEQLWVYGLVIVALLVLFMPVIRYLVRGWHAKRADIMDGLNKDSRLKYFQMFCRTAMPMTPDEAFVSMERMYTRSYGRRLFIAPCVLLVIVGAVSLFFVIGNVFRSQALVDGEFVGLKMELTGMAAIAGAYMWVVNDFISRARRLDFSPADIHWGVLRLTIAVPMGYALASIAAATVGPFVAFAAGSFPLATLNKILQRTALTKMGYNDTPEKFGDDVVKLQGVNNDIVDRLASEDITTVTQIAYCDPMRLTMRSNLTFNVVTDLMNQALAWTYLDDGMNKIRPFGLRGAVEIRHFVDSLDGKTDPQSKRRAQQALPDVVTALQSQLQTPATLQTAFAEIVGDPFTDYLYSIWE
jgi:hypothetical protein